MSASASIEKISSGAPASSPIAAMTASCSAERTCFFSRRMRRSIRRYSSSFGSCARKVSIFASSALRISGDRNADASAARTLSCVARAASAFGPSAAVSSWLRITA